MPRLKLPAPVMAFAVEPKSRGDEDKVLSSLRRLQEEDPTIDLHRDAQTGEQIVAGLSQVHVEVIVDRLRDRFGVEVALKPPRVPYQETIRSPAAAHGRHKKQSGGRGQFGDCHIEIEPLGDRRRRRGFEFVDKIKGGVIPGSFIPAVEKGVREAMESGRARRLPGEGRAGAPLRRPAPLRRLLRDRLQARRRAGDEAGARAGRPGAAGADHAGHAVGARGLRGRRHRRPQQPPRAPAGDGADRRDDRDQGRGADVGDAHLRARPALDHRRPGRLHARVPALRGGARAPRAEGRRAGGRGARPRRTRSARTLPADGNPHDRHLPARRRLRVCARGCCGASSPTSSSPTGARARCASCAPPAPPTRAGCASATAAATLAPIATPRRGAGHPASACDCGSRADEPRRPSRSCGCPAPRARRRRSVRGLAGAAATRRRAARRAAAGGLGARGRRSRRCGARRGDRSPGARRRRLQRERVPAPRGRA